MFFLSVLTAPMREIGGDIHAVKADHTILVRRAVFEIDFVTKLCHRIPQRQILTGVAVVEEVEIL